MAHRDEFVQAPDPVNDRASFDRWFQEELVPALGPASERDIHIYNYDDSGGHFVWVTRIRKETKMLELPPVFWFVHNEVVYIVPCITTLTSSLDRTYIRTICPALFDIPFFEKKPSDMITALNEGQEFDSIYIYYDPDAYRSDLDWGDAVVLVEALGDYPLDDHQVKFGFGSIVFNPVKP